MIIVDEISVVRKLDEGGTERAGEVLLHEMIRRPDHLSTVRGSVLAFVGRDLFAELHERGPWGRSMSSGRIGLNRTRPSVGTSPRVIFSFMSVANLSYLSN